MCSHGGTNLFLHVSAPSCALPRMLPGTYQELREDLDESPASLVQEVEWFWHGGVVFFGHCQEHRPQHPPC